VNPLVQTPAPPKKRGLKYMEFGRTENLFQETWRKLQDTSKTKLF
jgi:hypothetical protein